jgi:lactate dehydrogenase-like 2-hydroxyacid dehydrogenase
MQREPILKIGVFPEEMQRVIDTEFECHSEDDVRASPALAGVVRAIITRSNYVIPAEWLERLPKLNIISTSGVGYDGIPIAAARDRKVVVSNTPGVLDGAVSELAIALLLAMLRKIPASDRFVREGEWSAGAFPLTSGLAGKKVGIVGLGRIGQGIARRLAGFDVSIAYSASAPKQVPYEFFREVTALAAHADILVVCCPGGAATRHLINAEVLSQLGPQGYVVNVSRGSVVDEAALVEALTNRSIRGAALDVFESEPLTDSPLTKLPNTVLTPHAGSATEETRRVMLRLALDNIHRVLRGEAALTPV